MIESMDNIRPATPQDALVLENFLSFNNGEHHRSLARNYIRCMFSNDYRRPNFLILWENDQIIGAASYSEELFTVNTWGISWVSVHPQNRNQGHGYALVKSCLNAIKNNAQKDVTVVLATYPDRTRLYEKLNFKAGGQDHEGGSFMFLHLSAPL